MKTLSLMLILYCLCASTFAADNEIKILTFNVYRKPEIGANFYAKERMNKICKVLKNKKHKHNNGWDIVLIQEAWTVGSRKILKNCGYKYTVDIGAGKWRVRDRIRHRRGGIRPRPARHGKELNVESGLLILSNLPILKSIRYEYKNEGRLLGIFNDGEAIAAKSLYLVKAELANEESVWIGNTHLIANYCEGATGIDCDSYEVVRTKQMKEMKSVIDLFVGDEPLVFGGDLNAGEHKNAKDLSWKELPGIFPGMSQAPHDPIAVITSGPKNFFNKGHQVGGKLDHLYASPHFLIKDGQLAFDQTFRSKEKLHLNYSDHYGWESTVILK